LKEKCWNERLVWRSSLKNKKILRKKYQQKRKKQIKILVWNGKEKKMRKINSVSEKKRENSILS